VAGGYHYWLMDVGISISAVTCTTLKEYHKVERIRRLILKFVALIVTGKITTNLNERSEK